jgi:proteasome lid subunit RPN8/RPN11
VTSSHEVRTLPEFVVKVPAYLLDAINAHSRVEHPREACGFLAGTRGRMPERFIPVTNAHALPERFFRMADASVLAAFATMDELGEDPLVVYHSHTRIGSTSSLSIADIREAMDLDALHLVCCTAKNVNQPSVEIWRICEVDVQQGPPDDVPEEDLVEMEHEQRIRWAEAVALDIIDDVHPESPINGLVEGNRVRMVYAGSDGQIRRVVCTVGPRGENGDSVVVYPVRPGQNGQRLQIGLDRVRAVGILAEGQWAGETRALAASHLQQAAMLLGANETDAARVAIERAALLMPRVMPRPASVPHAYRPRRRSEA